MEAIDHSKEIQACKALWECRELRASLKDADSEVLKGISRRAAEIMDAWMRRDATLQNLEYSWQMIEINKQVFTDEDFAILTITKDYLASKLPARRRRR